MNPLQNKVNKVFKENFGYTPLKERLNDIEGGVKELTRWTDIPNLKSEAGDALASLIQLHNENGWSIEETLEATFEKISRRRAQYKTLGRKTKVAIYGGAFDPITKGHIQAAQFILNTSSEFDEVWLMPAYKHMYGKTMMSPEARLEMCKIASKVDGRIKVFDYEIANKLSGETFYLVKRLVEEKELDDIYNFSIAIGLDNANTFEDWVNSDSLEKLIRFVVIPRQGYVDAGPRSWYFKEPHIFLHGENPIMEVSSTQVRSLFSSYRRTADPELEKNILKLIDENVYYYIMENSLYE
jgi:nicotinate-nucleotide adenylyltransferase